MLLSELRGGVVARLKSISGLTVALRPMSTPAVPQAYVPPGDVTFNATMGRGSDDVELSVQVIMGRADDEAALDVLDSYASGHGTDSVRTALEVSLGGSDVLNACMVRVDGVEVGGISLADGQEYLVATFRVVTSIPGTV